MGQAQTSCNRCGECCREGGPVLHTEDLVLVKSDKIPTIHLITIRKGELVLNPQAGCVQPAKTELVKIKGKGRNWVCHYYDEQNQSCRMYELRPVACETLKCWDIEKILDIIEKDTLCRFDIVDKDSPLYDVIKEHEQLCPCPDFEYIAEKRTKISASLKEELEKRVRDDLTFRTRQVKAHQLQLADELFYFGRPLFQLLQPFGARILETPIGIELHWR